MYVPLDRDSPEPLSRQIAHYLEELIRGAWLPPKSKLPSTRALSRDLGISREPVEQAYAELAARALIAIARGQGAVVCATLPSSRALSLPFPESRSRDPLPSRAFAPTTPYAETYNLRSGTASSIHLPAPFLRSTLHDASLAKTALQGDVPAGGEIALRRAAGARFAECGVLRRTEDIAVFASLEVAVRGFCDLFVGPQGTLLLDGAADPRWIISAQSIKVKVVTLLGTEDPDTLQSVIQRLAPRLVVIPPRNGRLTAPHRSLSRSRAWLDACRQAGVPLVEELTEETLTLTALDPPPLSVLDRSGRVLSLLDFEDEVGGGLEAAAVAGGSKTIDRLRNFAHPSMRPLARLEQRVMAAALESPARSRLRRTLRERRILLAQSIARVAKRRLPDILDLQVSPGGSALRLDLPEGFHGQDFARAARARGVLIWSARDCGLPRSRDRFLLLDLRGEDEGRLLEAMRILGAIYDEGIPVHEGDHAR